MKPVARVCTMRVCKAGHRAQFGHQEDSIKPEAVFRGLHWMEKKRDPLGSCSYWCDMWKVAARRATLEVLGWAFVSRIRVFLILLDHPQSLPRISHCCQGIEDCVWGGRLNTRQLYQTELSLPMGLTVPGSQKT